MSNPGIMVPHGAAVRATKGHALGGVGLVAAGVLSLGLWASIISVAASFF